MRLLIIISVVIANFLTLPLDFSLNIPLFEKLDGTRPEHGKAFRMRKITKEAKFVDVLDMILADEKLKKLIAYGPYDMEYTNSMNKIKLRE